MVSRTNSKATFAYEYASAWDDQSVSEVSCTTGCQWSIASLDAK